ncbi:MAG: hypothetical protein JO247_21520 [Chloroflexi bacterium]|nr:hypothetical protein [Chloroflexota bacterium]
MSASAAWLAALHTMFPLPLLAAGLEQAIFGGAGWGAALAAGLAGAAAFAGVVSILEALAWRTPVRAVLACVTLLALLPAALGGIGLSLAVALCSWSAAEAVRWRAERQLLAFGRSSFILAAACLASAGGLAEAALLPMFVAGAIPRRPGSEAWAGMAITYLTPTAGALLLWLLCRGLLAT